MHIFFLKSPLIILLCKSEEVAVPFLMLNMDQIGVIPTKRDVRITMVDNRLMMPGYVAVKGICKYICIRI